MIWCLAPCQQKSFFKKIDEIFLILGADQIDLCTTRSDGSKAFQHFAKTGDYDKILLAVEKGHDIHLKKMMGETLFILRHSLDI